MGQPSRKTDPGHERARTDAGLTGDKIALGDPAAAPVQTDAETAGTPTSAQRAAESAQRQANMAKQAKSGAGATSFGSNKQSFGGGNRAGALLTAGALVALGAAGVIAALVSISGI